MKRKFSNWTMALFVVAIAFGTFGCGDDDNPAAPTTVDPFDKVAELGNEYFTTYTTPSGQPVNVTAPTVWSNMTAKTAAVTYHILDWRSPEHFALGHIDGAINVSIGNFESVLAGIPAGVTVLNTCYTGQTASHATALMNMLGYEAQNMKFGMCGWTADPAVSLEKWDNAIGDQFADWLVTETSNADVEYSFPELETDKTTAEDILLDRAQAYLAAGWKKISAAALYEDIEINNNGDDYFIVNYFAPTQYDAGHIPGAVRFQPKESLHSDNMLKYLPTDKKIVVYCFTGQTSSQIVSYLNSLGYDAYSLLYGVNGMCFSNGVICTTRYHAADTNYPVVSG